MGLAVENGSCVTGNAEISSDAHTVCSSPDLSFSTVLAKFERFHKDPVNVGLHVLTTPIIFLGWLSIATKAFGAPFVLMLAAVYVITLPLQMSVSLDSPHRSVFLTTLVIFCAALAAAGKFCRCGWMVLFALAAVGGGGQAVAHWGTGERGYMDAYVAECR